MDAGGQLIVGPRTRGEGNAEGAQAVFTMKNVVSVPIPSRLGGSVLGSGGDASARALATAREVPEDGKLIALYPEGTRSTDGPSRIEQHRSAASTGKADGAG